MTLSPMNLFIVISATWRLASLLANEPGAFGMFERFRRWSLRATVRNRLWRAFQLAQGVHCEWCNSVWFGGLITAAWVAFGDSVVLFCLPLALSAWAIVFKYVVQTLEQLREYVERLNKQLEEKPTTLNSEQEEVSYVVSQPIQEPIPG